jgi:hypothetical protein
VFAWGALLFNLLNPFAQFERGLIRERVKAGLRPPMEVLEGGAGIERPPAHSK